MGILSVILHCDLDSFYAQVERERLSLPRDAAVAVVQWRMALAVSYPARALGIKRGAHVDDIRAKAGDKVTIVHVETIGGGAAAHTPATTATDETQETQKVSLARYRKASAAVFDSMTAALAGFHAVFERASIDEAYIDVTAEVERRVRAAGEGGREAPPARTLVVGGRLDLQNETDLRLAFGADIAAEVRARVLRDCGYTVSAGVSVNKLLAKFASATNKPDGQTVVPLGAVEGLLAEVPLRKLRGLGGKLGREVEELGVQTAGEATRLAKDLLERKVGRKMAEYVYNSVRGVDESEVKERDKTKSLLAAKNFKGIMNLDEVRQRWLPILASELAERLAFDVEVNQREAKTLTVSFRVKAVGAKGLVSASRSTPMPGGGEGRGGALMTAAMKVLRKVMLEEKDHFTFPITFVGLTATNFVDRATGNENICKYFSSAGAENHDEASANADVRPKLSSLTNAEVHERRLQESADRELALRLHRQESVPSREKRGQASSIAKPVKRGGRKKGKSNVGARPATMDRFVFKTKDGAKR